MFEDLSEMIRSLDQEINSILGEYGNTGGESAQTKENDVDSTSENVVDHTSNNVVDVTSKNFVSSVSRNIVQSPFMQRQQKLMNMTTLNKKPSSTLLGNSKGNAAPANDSVAGNICARIAKIVNF